LSDLIDRRPHLLRSLAAQLLPPRLPSTYPGKHLAIDLSSLRTAEDVRQMLAVVLAAVAREFAPADGGCMPGCARFEPSRVQRVKSGETLQRGLRSPPALFSTRNG
jgi:hypothetical protein